MLSKCLLDGGYQGPRVLRGESDPEPDRSVACVIAGLAESFWTEDKASSQGPPSNSTCDSYMA